jgi:hypothetical protein
MTKTELQKLTKDELVDLVLKGHKESEELIATLDDMNATIDQLNQQKNDEKKGILALDHKKQRYVVVTPSFRFNNQKLGFGDLKRDEALVEAILKLPGQNILKLEKK